MWESETNGIDLFSCISNMIIDFGSEWWDQTQVDSMNWLGYTRANVPIIASEGLRINNNIFYY